MYAYQIKKCKNNPKKSMEFQGVVRLSRESSQFEAVPKSWLSIFFIPFP